MLKEKKKSYAIVLILLDIIGVILSDVLAVYVRFNSPLFQETRLLEKSVEHYFIILIWVIPLCILVYTIFGLYKRELEIDIYNIIQKTFLSNTLVALILMSLTFVIKDGWEYSRFVLVFFISFSIAIGAIIRAIYRKALKRRYDKGIFDVNVLLVGTDSLAIEYITAMQEYKSYGYNIRAILSIDAEIVGRNLLGLPVIGAMEDFEEIHEKFAFDEVVIALQSNQIENGKNILQKCDKEGIRIKFIPTYYEFVKADMNIERIGELPTMVIREVPLDILVNRIFKRCFDIIFSLCAIIATSPVMLFVAIGVKLSSPGPIFFKQERVGLNNKTFEMLKFRSMRIQTVEEGATIWTTKDDPRKTKFGSFIRKTSLDELPQFFNVLLGHMSVVGPRPERPFYVRQFKEEIPDYMLRHYVKSGITGWAQINGWRGDTSISERIKCDNYYIQNWSLFFDIKIVLLTVLKGFLNKNAY